MIELVVIGVGFVFFWVAVGRWARHLDGFFTLAALLPNKTDVADLENDLPHIPGDPHYGSYVSVEEYLKAVAEWKADRTYDEADQ